MIACSNPHAQFQSHRDETLRAVARVLDRGHYILGPEVSAFEQALAAYIGVPYAVGVNSGTDALILTLRALGIGPGDEVVTVSHTAVATVAAVIATGATPVIVDIEPNFWTMDPAGLEAALTPKTRAIVPVHLYGQAADMDTIMTIAGRQRVSVIEDCAQATGTVYKGRRAGSIGVAGCFSFYPTKNLGAIGDGGSVVTRDAALAERIARLRQYGWDADRHTVEPGLNSRLDEIQAAILAVKLPHLDADNARRREIADRYAAGLAGLPLVLPIERPATQHVYHLYVLETDSRDALKGALGARGVAAGVHYPVSAHLHGGYDAKCRLPWAGLPVTTALPGRILTLPMYPELTTDEVDRVIAALAGH